MPSLGVAIARRRRLGDDRSMEEGAPVLKTAIILAGALVLLGACSPRDVTNKAAEISLWAQRGFAESQADYGDSFPAYGGGDGYVRPPTPTPFEQAAAGAAAEKADAPAAQPPAPQYVVIMP
jgi:hypothetical protein